MNRTAIRSLAAVACSAALALSLAGCGGDDKKDDKLATLSADEFKTQANKLCADASKDTQSYGANISETSSEAEVTAAVKKTVERNQKMIADLENLKAPTDLADDFASMLRSGKEGVALMSQLKTVEDLKAFDPTGGPIKEADDKATALGLPDCAK